MSPIDADTSLPEGITAQVRKRQNSLRGKSGRLSLESGHSCQAWGWHPRRDSLQTVEAQAILKVGAGVREQPPVDGGSKRLAMGAGFTQSPAHSLRQRHHPHQMH